MGSMLCRLWVPDAGAHLTLCTCLTQQAILTRSLTLLVEASLLTHLQTRYVTDEGEETEKGADFPGSHG